MLRRVYTPACMVLHKYKYAYTTEAAKQRDVAILASAQSKVQGQIVFLEVSHNTAE